MTLSAPNDGLGDASAKLLNALQVCGSGSGGAGEHLLVPPGRYRLTRTIRCESVAGIGILGSGGRSVFLWDGPAGVPMFTLSDVRESAFRDFRISSNPSRPLAEAFRIENGGGVKVAPTGLRFEALTLDGTNDGGLGIGFRVSGQGAGGDNDSDFHAWRDCYVNHAAVAGWSLEATQAHGLLMEGCQIRGGGQFGLVADRWQGNGGTFHWRGGFIGGCDVAFRVGNNVGLPSTVEKVSLEGCGRLLVTGGPSGAPQPLSLRDVRFASNSLAEDGVVIDYRHPGPLELVGCVIGDDSSRPLVVSWNPIADLREMVPAFRITSCLFRSAFGAAMFLGRRPTTWDCSVKTPGGAVGL